MVSSKKINKKVHPSSMLSWMLNDPIVDILHENFPEKPNEKFTNFIMDLGNKFEANIYEEISRRFPNDFGYGLEVLKQGKSIIAQLPVESEDIVGTADLVVRGDFLDKFVPGTGNYNGYIVTTEMLETTVVRTSPHFVHEGIGVW